MDRSAYLFDGPKVLVVPDGVWERRFYSDESADALRRYLESEGVRVIVLDAAPADLSAGGLFTS